MRLMLLGCPGAGKGTQAQFIINNYHIPQISTGEMLRAAVKNGTELGKRVKTIMEKGDLVSDDIIIELVRERIQMPDCKKGFILDGFPRTLAQAEALDEQHIPIDLVIEIDVDNEEIVKRMSGRLSHPASGRVYHAIYNPPKNAGVDDLTGDVLVQRNDDKEETVRKRLEVYHEETKPLVKFYEDKAKHDPGIQFFRLDGTRSVEEIKQHIFEIIDNIK